MQPGDRTVEGQGNRLDELEAMANHQRGWQGSTAAHMACGEVGCGVLTALTKRLPPP